MKRVDLYTRSFCIWCLRAKLLLWRRGVRYVEHDASSEVVRAELLGRTGRRTVPQLFVDDAFVGGYDELAALDTAGELEALLRDALAT